MSASAPLRRALVAGSAALLVAASGFAQALPKEAPALTVRALAGDGTPVADAVVETWDVPVPRPEIWGTAVEEPRLLVSSATNASGLAAFEADAPAAWRVTVRAPGKATARRSVRVDPA